MPPDRAEVVRRWVESAEHDLRTAEHTRTLEPDCPYDTICFHAQQAAEKYLKALLVSHAIPFPKSHDLAEIVALLPLGVRVELSPADAARLTPLAVVSRYPGSWEMQTGADAGEALRISRAVRRSVRGLLDLG